MNKGINPGICEACEREVPKADGRFFCYTLLNSYT